MLNVLLKAVASLEAEKELIFRALKVCDHYFIETWTLSVDLPALSEKDRADLRFGVENEVDMIFASFIRKAQDIDEIRQCLGPAGEKPRVFISSSLHHNRGLDCNDL